MGHSRTPTQNTAGDGFPADPIDGSARSGRSEGRRPGVSASATLGRHLGWIACIITVLPRMQAQSKDPEVIPRRIFRVGALTVCPGLQPTAQQLVEGTVPAC